MKRSKKKKPSQIIRENDRHIQRGKKSYIENVDNQSEISSGSISSIEVEYLIKKPSLIRRENDRHIQRGKKSYFDNVDHESEISSDSISTSEEEYLIRYHQHSIIGGGREDSIRGCRNNFNSCPFDVWYELIWCLQADGTINAENFRSKAKSLYSHNLYRIMQGSDPNIGRDHSIGKCFCGSS